MLVLDSLDSEVEARQPPFIETAPAASVIPSNLSLYPRATSSTLVNSLILRTLNFVVMLTSSRFERLIRWCPIPISAEDQPSSSLSLFYLNPVTVFEFSSESFNVMYSLQGSGQFFKKSRL